jgi:hypothetical protein
MRQLLKRSPWSGLLRSPQRSASVRVAAPHTRPRADPLTPTAAPPPPPPVSRLNVVRAMSRKGSTFERTAQTWCMRPVAADLLVCGKGRDHLLQETHM